METRLLLRTAFPSIPGRCGILACCVLLLRLSSGQLQAADEPQDLAGNINHAAVFYQPLMWVGDTPPSDVENAVIWAEVQKMQKHGGAGSIPVLDQFVQTHTKSPWTPSLQANLGRYYFEHGLYTRALQDWEMAWAATKDAPDGPAKQVADFTFAYWTRLLARLGREDTLKTLFAQAQGRIFDGGSLQQLVNGAKDGYRMMLSDPGECFKCGTFALNNVARAIKGPEFTSEEMLQVPSPKNGFTMSQLRDLASLNGLDLTCADWGNDHQLIVPSVVHWKEDHYVAILQEKNGYYFVADPTFGKARWLTASEIQEEASGQFMVPTAKMPKDWGILASSETDKIFGRGFVDGTQDGDDGCGNGSGGGSGNGGGNGNGTGNGSNGSGFGGPFSWLPSCHTCGSGNGNGNGGTGGSGGGCCSADGSGSGGGSGAGPSKGNGPTFSGPMTTWEVSEPYINVWLYDEPIAYQPALGNRISFKLSYKQRESRTISPNLFGVGSMWDCSWLSYIVDDGIGATATMLVPGGGERTYTPDNSTEEYYSHTILKRTTYGTNLTGFVLTYANGAKDYYTNLATEQLDMQQVVYLTSKVDAYGHATTFVYQDSGGYTTLQYVIDTDGRTNTLSYTDSTYPAQITGVQDPFRRTTTLSYDSNGILTNILDPVGINSCFKYDWQGWVTNLTTPYGLTSFTYCTNGTDASDGEFGNEYYSGGYDPYLPTRAVTVVDAAGGTNVYMLRQDCSLVYTNENDYYTNGSAGVAFIPDSYGPWDTGYPFDYSNSGPPSSPFSFDNGVLYFRDSFHWNPKQAAGLPADLTTLSPYDLIKARMRHWLHGGQGSGGNSPVPYLSISQSCEMEQDPSPDGITPGQMTWIEYDGQGGYHVEGTDSQPGAIAKLQPDGTTWYTQYVRDDWGRPTNVISTLSESFGDTPQTRTNVYLYGANEVNLVQSISPLGETTGYAYDATNNLLFMTNAAGEVTAYPIFPK